MSTGAIDPQSFTAAAVSDLEQTRRNVTALGDAIQAVEFPTSPALARAVQAQQNLFDTIGAEFGLLTSAEVGAQMGSRSASRRNLAIAARADGRLLALHRGNRLLYPGFQFDPQGNIRPGIGRLRAVAVEHDWDETSLIEWLVAPTTYLAGRRPVDVIEDLELLVRTAENALGVSW